jgi:hypothetical protein
MTQADSVHSTPRTSSSKIKAHPPTTEDRIRIDASRAHAYCGLESQVTECFLQAEVAAIVVHDTLSDAEPRVTADQAMAVTHAVYQLVADVRALHAQYSQYFESGAKAVQS